MTQPLTVNIEATFSRNSNGQAPTSTQFIGKSSNLLHNDYHMQNDESLANSHMSGSLYLTSIMSKVPPSTITAHLATMQPKWLATSCNAGIQIDNGYGTLYMMPYTSFTYAAMLHHSTTTYWHMDYMRVEVHNPQHSYCQIQQN